MKLGTVTGYSYVALSNVNKNPLSAPLKLHKCHTTSWFFNLNKSQSIKIKGLWFCEVLYARLFLG